MAKKPLVIVRGGGDIATGTICRLHKCGFRLLVLETAQPLCIRRSVALAEAVYTKNHTVEGVTAQLSPDLNSCEQIWNSQQVPIFIDPGANSLQNLQPDILIDAILAKRNIGTHRNMANLTIALGPGFEAGVDVDIVIETARGHNLGRLITTGSAQDNTGIPGSIKGYTRERVIYARNSGVITVNRDIGNQVKKGELIAHIGNHPVFAPIEGVVRGMIRNGLSVKNGLKIGDIDPRIEEIDNCYTISDKARCISGGTLEAILSLKT